MIVANPGGASGLEEQEFPFSFYFSPSLGLLRAIGSGKLVMMKPGGAHCARDRF